LCPVLVVSAAEMNDANTRVLGQLARGIGAIIVETMALPHFDRVAEIERRVRKLTA